MSMNSAGYFVFLVVISLNAVVEFLDANTRDLANRRNANLVQRQRTKRSRPQLNPDDSVRTMISKLLTDYNKQEPPLPDRTTTVSIGIYVISFYSISEQTMDYSVSMYLRQTWKDPRLTFREFRGKRQVRLGEGQWKEIWIPDTFLRNEKAANFHTVTVENRMLKLDAPCKLWYVTKITATLSCPMYLHKFPMDTQICSMLFESFGYTMDTMSFDPLSGSDGPPIDISKDLQLPQFKIIDHEVINCTQNYTTGVYPCLEFRFILRRDIGYFLIQVYVPSVLIVILSWVSFWINVDASPARVSIGLLTVLTTTTMSSGARATLPRVSYIKAIDVWMIICLLFVFLSLIEYAVVNVLARRPAVGAPRGHPQRRGPGLPPSRRDVELGTPLQPIGRRNPPKTLSCFVGDRRMDAIPDQPPSGGVGARGGGAAPPCKGPPPVARDGKFRARQVDKLSRKCFPLSFLLFNVVYWAVYSTGNSASTH